MFALGPIFAREWTTLPRNGRPQWMRGAWIGLFSVIALTCWLSTTEWSRASTYLDMSRLSPLIFQVFTAVQLVILVFFAALAAASAVALEKDRRTFLLLLITDLSNHEIVLGKILGSMLPLIQLPLATLPLLILLVATGGVGLDQVLLATALTWAAMFAGGGLGGLMALWRERTFPALALTALSMVLYLLLVQALKLIPGLADGPQNWLLTVVDPFTALLAVLDPSGLAPAGGYGGLLAHLGWMTALAMGLLGAGVVMLRVWNPSGEPIMQRELPADAPEEETDRLKAHSGPGKPRSVFGNPILWRETHTRAYGRRPLLIQGGYLVVLALIIYGAAAPLVMGEKFPFAAAYGLVPVAVLSLLLVTAQAVTAITSEKDLGALDLLLVTDLTAPEFVFGKLLGIFRNTLLYIVPPMLLAGWYGYMGLLASPPARYPELARSMNASALLSLLGGATVVFAFTMVLGIHIALRARNSRGAILTGLGAIFFLTVGTLVTIALILVNGRFEYQWASFLAFLGAGIGGLWWVLNGERPSSALTLASWLCPLAVFYAAANLVVGKPGTLETGDPLIPFLVISGSFGFAIAAMLVPLLSEFDVAMGRTSGGAD